ncbi:MAG: hypothetical protein FWD17_01020 [Polyangiaceae bacterium]|nr:hypothetical protein [Polyangiaceae bacterium]
MTSSDVERLESEPDERLEWPARRRTACVRQLQANRVREHREQLGSERHDPLIPRLRRRHFVRRQGGGALERLRLALRQDLGRQIR